MKIIRKTAIVMLLCLYFLTYGVLPQVQAAGKDAPVIVVAHRAGVHFLRPSRTEQLPGIQLV